MQSVVVPNLRTVVFAGLPVVITEVEGVGGLDYILFAHTRAKVGVHGVEGYVFVPRVDIRMKLHAFGQLVYLDASPMRTSVGGRTFFVVHAAIDESVHVVVCHLL